MSKYKYDFSTGDLPSNQKEWNDYFEEYDKYQNDEFAKVANLPDGLHVGKMFSISVADGEAWYQITKILKTKVQLKWRKDLCPDQYADHHFFHGGSFDKNDVERYIHIQDGSKEYSNNNLL